LVWEVSKAVLLRRLQEKEGKVGVGNSEIGFNVNSLRGGLGDMGGSLPPLLENMLNLRARSEIRHGKIKLKIRGSKVAEPGPGYKESSEEAVV